MILPSRLYSLNSFVSVTLLLAPTIVGALHGGDWPQIHGPYRNGTANSEYLDSDWTELPIKRWSVAIGEGYAGPAVVGRQVFIFHREGPQDVLDSRRREDGSVRWSVRWPASYRGGVDSDHGPRCVPVVHDGRIYLWSAAGWLHCVDTSGKKRWSRNLAKDFRARDGYFGFGSTPLVTDGLVLVNVGGGKGAAVVAVDVESGQDRWQQFDDTASYAAPIAWNYAGQRCAVCVTRLHLVGIRATTGDVLFRTPFGARGPTVNAAAPIALDDNRLFATASYRIGAKVFEINASEEGKSTINAVWENDDSLSSQYPTPVFSDGCLYGVHGREDGPAASLRCIEATTGEVKWTEQGVGMAHLILADNKLLMLTTDGELALLNPSKDSYQELGRCRISTSITRALPALSDGRIFVRSVDGQLAAWQLPAREAIDTE